MSGAFAAAHLLKRGNLLGPLIGKVQLHLKVMIVISNLTRDRAHLLERRRELARMIREGFQDLAPLLLSQVGAPGS